MLGTAADSVEISKFVHIESVFQEKKMTLEETIMEYVVDEYLEDDDDDLDIDSPLISAGIVDSFSMVSLKAFLENKYEISIPDEKASPEAFDSVKKIAALVREFKPDI